MRAALNLLAIVDRSTVDVDVLARLDETGALRPPDPLPEILRRAIVPVARDRGLLENWINTTVADQWRFGFPTGLAERIEWRSFGGRRDLIFFKLYAAADQTGPDNVHVRDLLALKPNHEELEWAAEWVRAQDASPDFPPSLPGWWRMSKTRFASLARELHKAAAGALWIQWQALGGQAAESRAPAAIVDPEALVLASLWFADDEPRLRDFLYFSRLAGEPRLQSAAFDSIL